MTRSAKRRKHRTPDASQTALRTRLQTGAQLHQAGQLEQAKKIYQDILAHEPEHADALHLLGVIAYQHHELDEAIEMIGRALHIKPDAAPFHNNIGNAYKDHGRPDEARQHYERAIQIDPKFAEPHNNIGNLLVAQDRAQEALAYYEQALLLRPNYSDAMINLANALTAAGEYQRATQTGMALIAGGEQSADLYNNLAIALKAQGKIEHALQCLQAGLRQQSTHAQLHWNRSITQLQVGDLANGWQDYHWGAKTQIPERRLLDLPCAAWRGEASPAHLLIYGEQGIGDEIMFLSCLAPILEQAGQCTLACEPRLAPLVSRSFPRARVLSGYAAQTLITYCQQERVTHAAPIADLAVYRRGEFSQFAPASPYLHADEAAIKTWRERYQQLKPGIKIGISWRGGHNSASKKARSIDLSLWQALLQTPDAVFINLQYGDCTQELESFARQSAIHIHHWEDVDPLSNMDDFAAQIAALDLVICIDNSTVHLAGALGVPTWVLLPYVADWRWFLEREDSPWYDSLYLIRARTSDDWPAVFTRVQQALHKRLEGEKNTARMFYEQPTACTKQSTLLLNDTTSWYHWGCTGTSTALKELLAQRTLVPQSISIQAIQDIKPLAQTEKDFSSEAFYLRFCFANRALLEQLTTASDIVINGEGSLHGQTPLAQQLLYLAFIAKNRLHKKVHIINHSCYPQDDGGVDDKRINQLYIKVYEQLDSIAVRESTSANLLRRLGLSCIDSFDCLPLYIQNHYQMAPKTHSKRIVIAGSAAWTSHSIAAVSQFIQRMCERGYTIEVLTGAKAHAARDDTCFIDALRAHGTTAWKQTQTDSIEQWLDCIAQAALLLSGRFHHSIAAAFLHTPLVVLNSNTPKISGLMHMLGLAPPLAHEAPQLLQEMLERADQLLSTARGVTEERLAQLRALALNNLAHIGVDETPKEPSQDMTTPQTKPKKHRVIERRLDQCQIGLLVYELSDRPLEQSIAQYGECFCNERPLLEKLIKSGDHIVHIAADIGVRTVELAQRVSETGLVYAFEAQERRYQFLSANLAINGINNVHCIKRRVSSKTQLHAEPVGHTETVCIDELALTRCDMILLDCAQALEEVLAGARRTIAQCKPFLYLAVDKSNQHEALIQELGYEAMAFSPAWFNPQNFLANTQNIFAEATLDYLVCTPKA